jgi:hypothetical protein
MDEIVKYQLAMQFDLLVIQYGPNESHLPPHQCITTTVCHVSFGDEMPQV